LPTIFWYIYHPRTGIIINEHGLKLAVSEMRYDPKVPVAFFAFFIVHTMWRYREATLGNFDGAICPWVDPIGHEH
jgi:hypothetical protein